MKNSQTPRQIPPELDWQQIDTVLLDMDGTLLDGYFDDFFWETYVPEIFARENGLSKSEARKVLLAKYQRVENTLSWSNLDYWSEQLDLDIPELTCKIDHLIEVHPYVVDFLQFVQSTAKQLFLVTNAHSKTLDIKLAKTPLGPYFQRIITAHEVGEAKEQPRFWRLLQELLGFQSERTLLVDDNARVLRAAFSHGLHQLVYVARPSSRQPVRFSKDFPSIVFFNELLPENSP